MTEPFLAAKCPLFDTGTESRSLFTLSGHCTPKQHIRSRRPLFKVAHRASASCFPLKHSVFSFLIFKLKDNCFPEFCGFLSYTTKNQHRYTHVPASSPLPFSLSQKPCLTSWITQQIPTGYLFYTSYYKFLLTLSIHLPFSLVPSPHVYRSVLYVCFSFAALKVNSPVPSL